MSASGSVHKGRNWLDRWLRESGEYTPKTPLPVVAGSGASVDADC
jgi:hypothetical protein